MNPQSMGGNLSGRFSPHHTFSKRARRFSLLVLAIVMSLLVLSTAFVRAGTPTNNQVASASGQKLGSSSFTVSSQPFTQAGDVAIMSFQVYPSSCTVSTISDGSGDVWGQGSQNNGLSFDLEQWWTEAVGTSTNTITVTMSGTCSAINWGIATFDTFSNVLLTHSTTGSTLSATGSYTSTLTTGNLNIPAGSLFYMLVGSYNSNIASCSTLPTNKPPSSLQSEGVSPGGAFFEWSGLNCNVSGYDGQGTDANTPIFVGMQAAYLYTVSGSTDQYIWTESGNCVGCHADVAFSYLVFSTNGVSVPVCTGPSQPGQPPTFGSTFGPTNPSGSTMSITSNQTYTYTAQTGVVGAILLNLTTRIEAVALTNHQTTAVMNLNVYFVASGGAITAANPAILKYQFLVNLVNTATPTTYSTIVNLNAPTNGQVVVGFGVSHNGVTAYIAGSITSPESTPGIDTADTWSGGLAPATLKNIAPNAGNTPYFTLSVGIPCVVTYATTVTVNSGTGTAVSTTITTVVTSLDQNAAVSTTTNFVVVILVLLTPSLLLGGAMGAFSHSGSAAGVGAAAGLLIGTGIGNYSGLVPFWLVIVMILATIFIMFGVWRSNQG